MGNSYFRFKQFTVNQEDVSMKVNTDGVLLGAWCPLNFGGNSRRFEEGAKILDIGTGTGVIALILAQRVFPMCTKASIELKITGIDIDEASCMTASGNFAGSRWASVLECKHVAVQEYVADHTMAFDIVISNPPYFSNSLKSVGKRRTDARHNDSLSYKDLIECSIRLLKDSGSFVVILPVDEFSVFEKIANERFLFVRRTCAVYAKDGAAEPKRIMAELVKGLPKTIERESLAIQNNDGLTQEYKAITKDFYL